jgi:hypothetical protein
VVDHAIQRVLAAKIAEDDAVYRHAETIEKPFQGDHLHRLLLAMKREANTLGRWGSILGPLGTH